MIFVSSLLARICSTQAVAWVRQALHYVTFPVQKNAIVKRGQRRPEEFRGVSYSDLLARAQIWEMMEGVPAAQASAFEVYSINLVTRMHTLYTLCTYDCWLAFCQDSHA